MNWEFPYNSVNFSTKVWPIHVYDRWIPYVNQISALYSSPEQKYDICIRSKGVASLPPLHDTEWCIRSCTNEKTGMV